MLKFNWTTCNISSRAQKKLNLQGGVRAVAGQGMVVVLPRPLWNNGRDADRYYGFQFSLSDAPNGGRHIGRPVVQKRLQ
jgi:hypothetical protein